MFVQRGGDNFKVHVSACSESKSTLLILLKMGALSLSPSSVACLEKTTDLVASIDFIWSLNAKHARILREVIFILPEPEFATNNKSAAKSSGRKKPISN